MYDIHCHLLPDIDDGPDTLEKALAMCRIAVSDGIDTVIATPHGTRVASKGGRAVLEDRVNKLKEALASNHIGLEIRPGIEYLLSADLVNDAETGEAVTLAGSHYVLVEIDFQQWPPYTADALFKLQLAGYAPVLAHPERQANIQRSPELLADLVERGIFSEVTAGSILGDFGGRARKSAEQLVERGLVHFIASDGHTPTANRPPVMARAKGWLTARFGEEAADVLAVSNPYAVLNGRPVQAPPIEPPQRRRLLRFGRR